MNVMNLAFKKLIILSPLFVAVSAVGELWQVPTFTPQDLQLGLQDELLRETLTTSGLLAIRIPAGGTGTNNDALAGICQCRENFGVGVDGGDRILLADGLTVRSTIATATVGTDHPLSLPEHGIKKQCGSETYKDLERARDYVSQAASELFVPALDRVIQESSSEKHTILKTKHGASYKSVRTIVQDAVNLEHFHSYAKKNISEEGETTPIDPALNWHTDGGLFLAFLPAKTCHDHRDHDDSFRLKLRGSDAEVLASFPPIQDGEVIVAIMLGAGSESWLNTPSSLKLRATRHAVKMSSGDQRAWYGMMFQVPPESIVQTSPQLLTFAEMKKASVHSGGRRFSDDKSNPDNVVIGCGVGQPFLNNYSSPVRHRLQHVGGPEDCNNVDNFFCWLSCLDLPDSDKSIAEHFADGESMYCLDASVMASKKDLKAAVAACSDSDGTAGGIHQPGCENHWYQTTEGVQSYLEEPEQEGDEEYASDLLNEKYCYGGTGMYMQGFEWESSTCIIFLFTPWVVTSRAALAGACFGTIFLGVLVEFIIRQRRAILTRKFKKGTTKMALSALFYGLQLTSSYMLMLVVMVYSVPLFISVIVGLVSGHVLFNLKNITGKDSGAATLEGSTPCCQNVVDENVDASEGEEKESITTKEEEKEGDCCAQV